MSDQDGSVDKGITELGGKVDALLKRHTGGPAEDRNIPVLSEIVRAPEWKPVTPLALPQGLTDAEATKLAHEIFERVWQTVERDLTNRLEERLAERMAAQISVTVGHVLSDLSPEIANVIGDAINEALVRKPAR